MMTPRTTKSHRCCIRNLTATRRSAKTSDRDQERHQHDLPAVDDRDHHERRQVVDDEHRDQEDAHPVGDLATEQRQNAERQRGVGRHRDAPAVGAVTPGVERQVDEHRDHHAEQADGERKHEATPLAQVAEVELPTGFEADDEEEQRHQPAVDPRPQIVVDNVRPEPDRQVGVPQRLVGGQSRDSPRRARRRHRPVVPRRCRTRSAGRRAVVPNAHASTACGRARSRHPRAWSRCRTRGENGYRAGFIPPGLGADADRLLSTVRGHETRARRPVVDETVRPRSRSAP